MNVGNGYAATFDGQIMISTRLTKLLGIRHPVVQAPMGLITRAELAAAVANAGGLGIMSMVRMSPDFIREQIRKTRVLTSRPFGINLIPAIAPMSGIESQLEVCLEERVPVLSLFWCDATPFVERCHAAGIMVMLQIGSVEEARSAAAAGVDIIVAQGMEAGGHVRGQVGLLPFLPTVVEAVASVPVLAAGGIVNGRGLAAALSLGADGVSVGTRFVASVECEAHADYKRRLLDAAETDTVYGEVFNVGWPQAPHRVLKNALTDGTTPPTGPIARIQLGEQIVDVPPFGSAPPTVHTVGQTKLMANYAGQGVGLIRDILPAGVIVDQLVNEAENTIRGLSRLLS
jgi:NAD(P)H-dependent flavin oxidoreductase YrpB (nitropropane dioxygenase family)